MPFGWKRYWLGGFSPEPTHREVQKTALGAENSVAWEKRSDLTARIAAAQTSGYQVVVVEQTSDSVLLPDFAAPAGPVVLVVGNEVTGVREDIVALADAVAEIPQWGTKHSLNVSVAAGIVLYALLGHLPVVDARNGPGPGQVGIKGQ